MRDSEKHGDQLITYSQFVDAACEEKIAVANTKQEKAAKERGMYQLEPKTEQNKATKESKDFVAVVTALMADINQIVSTKTGLKQDNFAKKRSMYSHART